MATVVKRGNSYKVQVCVGEINGKKIFKSKSFKCDPLRTEKQNKKAAEEFARKFETECRNGTAATGDAKFSDIIEQYFIDYAPKRLKEQTITSYKSYKPYVDTALGYKPIADIKTTHIQSFVNNLCEDGMSQRRFNIDPETGERRAKALSAKTIYNYIAFMSSVFRYAISQGIVYSNPCKGAVLPQKRREEVEVYTLQEAQELLFLLQKEPFNRRLAFILAMYCGFRRGEIYGLEWKDINFENSTITINRASLHTPARGTYTDEPKTEKSKRCNKVSSSIMQVLRQYRAWQNERRLMVGSEWQDYDRLFTTWNGEPENPNNIENWWMRFCKRTGFKYIKFHSLRHFNATMLIANNADIKTVSASLGHSNISTTMDIYAHSIAEQQAAQAQALDDKIGINLVAENYEHKKA